MIDYLRLLWRRRVLRGQRLIDATVTLYKSRVIANREFTLVDPDGWDTFAAVGWDPDGEVFTELRDTAWDLVGRDLTQAEAHVLAAETVPRVMSWARIEYLRSWGWTGLEHAEGKFAEAIVPCGTCHRPTVLIEHTWNPPGGGEGVVESWWHVGIPANDRCRADHDDENRPHDLNVLAWGMAFNRLRRADRPVFNLPVVHTHEWCGRLSNEGGPGGPGPYEELVTHRYLNGDGEMLSTVDLDLTHPGPTDAAMGLLNGDHPGPNTGVTQNGRVIDLDRAEWLGVALLSAGGYNPCAVFTDRDDFAQVIAQIDSEPLNEVTGLLTPDDVILTEPVEPAPEKPDYEHDATTLSPMAGYGGSIPVDATVLTLGEFRRFTSDLPGDVQIVVDDGDSWWLNVPTVIVPDGENFHAITLTTADTFDTRQF